MNWWSLDTVDIVCMTIYNPICSCRGCSAFTAVNLFDISLKIVQPQSAASVKNSEKIRRLGAKQCRRKSIFSVSFSLFILPRREKALSISAERTAGLSLSQKSPGFGARGLVRIQRESDDVTPSLALQPSAEPRDPNGKFLQA